MPLEDPSWGPVLEAAPPAGHPIANRALAARAVAGHVWLEGGEIHGQAVAGGCVLHTRECTQPSYGLAQLRRLVQSGPLRLLHVVFAPARDRPLLLGLVRLENVGRELVRVDYTELWEVPGAQVRAEAGACVCRLPAGERALADAGTAIFARAPESLPQTGLALEARLALPPGGRRELAFAYAAPGLEEAAASLVRAWRGEAAAELALAVRVWSEFLPAGPNSVEAYRVEAAGWVG